MNEQTAAAIVVEAKPDQVLVSIPLKGFPPGFQLRPGERVSVSVDESGLVAWPLVQPVIVNESCEDLARQGRIDIHGETHTCQEATAHGHSAPNTTAPSIVWVIDPGTAGLPKQIIATRPHEPVED